jgi:hypothetical protein
MDARDFFVDDSFACSVDDRGEAMPVASGDDDVNGARNQSVPVHKARIVSFNYLSCVLI